MTSYVDGNNELRVEMTDSNFSSSVESSNEKKARNSNSDSAEGENSSKKTLMTNLSGSIMKSERDLTDLAGQKPSFKRRKSL